MEFEAEEEMQIQKLQQKNGSARLAPPVPQKFHPPKTVSGQHPGMATPLATGAKDQRSKEVCKLCLCLGNSTVFTSGTFLFRGTHGYYNMNRLGSQLSFIT